jgi:uncharacterized membrane protein
MSQLEREFWAGVFAAAVLFVMNVLARLQAGGLVPAAADANVKELRA